MRRRDFLVEHIMGKSFIEDVMKSIAWTTLCGAVYAISMAALKSGGYFQGFVSLGLSGVLSILSLMYVALHVVIPMDSAMYPDDPFWDEKSQKLKGVSKWGEAFKIFITRHKIFYLSLSMGYFFYAREVANYLAANCLQ